MLGVSGWVPLLGTCVGLQKVDLQALFCKFILCCAFVVVPGLHLIALCFTGVYITATDLTLP